MDSKLDDLPADRPYFEGVYGLSGHPLRHIFMGGTVWRLAQQFGGAPLRILEVGSWCGVSTLTWAHALKVFCGAGGEITCLDPWEPFIDLEANDDDNNRGMETALRNGTAFSVFSHNVQFVPEGIETRIVRARSDEALRELDEAAYHLVYIDGDHTYAAVRRDLELAKPLVADGGVLCGDDLELQGDECDTSVVEDAPGIDQFEDPDSARWFHPGVTRAVWEQLGRVSAWYGYWAAQRERDGWRELSLEGMPFFIPSHLPARHLVELKSLFIEHFGESG